MDTHILQELSAYGPIAVLVLLMLPLMGEDVIIIPAGYLTATEPQTFPLVATFICAYIGAFFSDAMWYVLCYRFGAPLLHKRWFKRLAHPRRMLQAKHQVEKRGAWMIVIARFIPGSRTSTMIVSGLMHMPIWKFTFAEGSCLLVSVALQIWAGRLVAKNIYIEGTTGRILTIAGVIVVLLALGFIGGRIAAMRKSGGAAPRSKVKWLKRFRNARPARLPRMGAAADHR